MNEKAGGPEILRTSCVDTDPVRSGVEKAAAYFSARTLAISVR